VVIKFDDVTKIYQSGARPALDGVSVEIERGEFVFLVGSSGSGKSTFLSLIIRAERANSGQVQVAGKNLNTLTNWRVPGYRQQLGVVFQDFRLLQNKTVYENVAFALKVIGKPRRSISVLVPEALKIVGLEDKANRMPYELSGGEQQRVAIARAFVNRPLIILADEPTGNLDPATSAEIMRVFEMINQMGTTIVMATHSEEIVNSMRKRVIELHHGKVIRDELNAKYVSRVDTDELSPEEAAEAEATSAPPVPKHGDTDTTTRLPRLPRIKRASDPAASQRTVRIPKMPRMNDYALDGNDNALDTDMFEQFFNTTNDLFETGAFDTAPFRKGDEGERGQK
jgi:cell division transport system ATP-binding protein